MMNAVKNDIEALVPKELNSANERFPQFHSAHEGYAVLLEEVEELEEKVKGIENFVQSLWWHIRQNTADKNPDCVGYYLDDIRNLAITAAVEAVQVAAMCDKFKTFLRSDDNA